MGRMGNSYSVVIDTGQALDLVVCNKMCCGAVMVIQKDSVTAWQAWVAPLRTGYLSRLVQSVGGGGRWAGKGTGPAPPAFSSWYSSEEKGHLGPWRPCSMWTLTEMREVRGQGLQQAA